MLPSSDGKGLQSTTPLRECSKACKVGSWLGRSSGGFEGMAGTTKHSASAGWSRALLSPIHAGSPARSRYHIQCCSESRRSEAATASSSIQTGSTGCSGST
jgi:hypothetical protein